MKKGVLVLGMLATFATLYFGMGNMKVQAEELPDEVFTVTVVSGTTGDDFPIALFLVLCLFSGTGLLYLFTLE